MRLVSRILLPRFNVIGDCYTGLSLSTHDSTRLGDGHPIIVVSADLFVDLPWNEIV